MTSDQELIQTPNLSAPGGTFINNFSGGPTIWSRLIQINDNDPKGSYNFAGLSAISLSNIEQTSISSGQTYTLGGFVSRIIPLEAFNNESTFNVPVSDYNKVVVSWSFNSNVNNRQPLDTPTYPPITGGWCLISPIDSSNVNVRILDDSYSSNSQSSLITIEETV